jgi:hypothetical protein
MFTGSSFAIFLLAIIAFLFGYPMVDDKIELVYKHDSKIMNRLIEKSKITQINFKVCLAGTVAVIQMITMLVVELFYHKFRT